MDTRDDEDPPTPPPTAPRSPERSTPMARPDARSLTTQQLEAVIRRAVELEARSERRPEEGVSEAEAVRIGQELGLDPASVRRAVAEVRTRPPEERGVLAAAMGPATVRASRVIPRPAAKTAERLERYLHDTEVMVTQRRFPDRTRYVRDSSLIAGVTRFARDLSRGRKPIGLKELDAATAPLDDGSCLLEVSVDLSGARAGHGGGAIAVGGSLASGLAITIWATPVADPLMLLGIPVLAGAWGAMRAIYAGQRRSTAEKLETLLDRVEHDDLT